MSGNEHASPLFSVSIHHISRHQAVSQTIILVYFLHLNCFPGCNTIHEPMPLYGVSMDPCATGV